MPDMQDNVLGQDFLTWLWGRSELNNGLFRTRQAEEYVLVVEKRIAVQAGEGDSLETATVSGVMSSLREARLGLATGKKVSRALLRLEHGPETWQFTLKASDFSINSLKTPTVDKNAQPDDPDGLFLEKMYLLERCLYFLDETYAAFLAIRLSDQWPAEVAAIRQWLAEDAD